MNDQTIERLNNLRISISDIAESAETLLQDICQELLQASKESPHPLDDKTKILIAVAKRAVNSSRAIRSLAANDEFYEDINVMCRALFETVINGAYLQFATTLEVETYMGFDVIPIAKALGNIEKFAPGKLSEATPPVLRQAFQQRLKDVKQATGKSEKDFGWTRLDVVSRAKKVDQATKTDLFVYFAQGFYTHGHAFVHGNHRSLARLFPAREDGGAPTHFSVTQSIYITVLAIVGFATFVVRLRLPGLEFRAVGIATLLDGFTRQMTPCIRHFNDESANAIVTGRFQ